MSRNALVETPRGTAAAGAPAVVPRRGSATRTISRTTAASREAERARLARDIADQLGSLLVSLRMDIAWIDQRLAEQAGSAPDMVQAMRLQMRIRCDGMDDVLERAVENLGRIVSDLQHDGDGTGTAALPSAKVRTHT